MAAITNWTQHAAFSTPDGYKVVIGAIHHSTNYAVTGDTVAAGTVGLNAIVQCMYADSQNALVASWSNSAGAMKLLATQNSTTTNATLVSMAAATNAINYQTVCAFVGKVNIG